MNRIIRTALASVGAAVVITGGGLGVAYATTPTSAPAQTSASADADQVAALNQTADDLLAKIATLEKQLASTPDSDIVGLRAGETGERGAIHADRFSRRTSDHDDCPGPGLGLGCCRHHSAEDRRERLPERKHHQ